MKIQIESSSQEEFDQKRADLIKAIAGSKLKVKIEKKGQRLATDSREPYYNSQKEILGHWDKKFKKMISDIKADIDEII